MPRRVGGKKYAPRLCKHICEFIGHDGMRNTHEIYDFLLGRTKMAPTRNQLSNILGRAPFFLPVDKEYVKNTYGNMGEITVWMLDSSQAISEGLLPPKSS